MRCAGNWCRSSRAEPRSGASRAAGLRVALALLGLCCSVAALAQEPVFGEGRVSEQALIEALAPRTPAAAGMGRARGFTPVTPPTATAAAPQRASLLVTFVVDSAELTAPAKSTLDIVARAMQSERLAGQRFRIEGHADPRGSEAHNLALSRARAAAVVGHLVTVGGIAASRLAPVGLGSSRLMNTNDPTAPENRRVTLVAH